MSMKMVPLISLILYFQLILFQIFNLGGAAVTQNPTLGWIGSLTNLEGSRGYWFIVTEDIEFQERKGAHFELFEQTCYYLSKKQLNESVGNMDDYMKLLEDTDLKDNIQINFVIYKLLGNDLYLHTAYKGIVNAKKIIADDLKVKFLSYPMIKSIVELYNNISNESQMTKLLFINKGSLQYILV